jgi:cobalt-zinc-cadmium efflux system outer membrane protein
VVLGVALLFGCARYQPRPIDPPSLEKDYRSRSLSAQGLRAYVEANRREKPARWPPEALDLETLTLAALYFHPDLDVARARLRTAEAAVITAGGRINPSAAGGAGYTNAPESPWVFRFDSAFTIETAGKRGKRILLAERQAEVARLALAEMAWRVRSHVRSALLGHIFAVHRRELLAAEEAVRAETVAIMENRFAVGEVSRPDVDAAMIELSNTRVSLQGANGQVDQTLADLAAAAGLTVAGLENARVAWPDSEQPPAPESLPLEKVQEAGLLNRGDVRRSLMEYAVAEASLQLEVARQYPNVELSPGYSFDEGHQRFAFGPGLSLPVLNRNEGPIGEAEARREEAQASFIGIEAQAIAEMETGLARYRAAVAEFSEADRQWVRLQRENERAMRRKVEAGEEDRLALAGVRLQTTAAATARLDTLRRAMDALGALEDAVQRPLPSGLPIPGAPTERVR